MPNFKPKANKKFKINKKTTTTLDSKHHEKMASLIDWRKKSFQGGKRKKKSFGC